MLQTLPGASGPDLDRRYVQLQVRGHQDSIALFDQYAQNGDSPQLKQLAQQTVPALREHLQLAEQIRSSLPPDQVGQAPGATPPSAGQQADASRIVVQQAAPTVRVDQASPQVRVQQAQPTVTVRQPQPEIVVRQPQPTVTVDIPQPEIILRMPQPDVNVAMAQPQVEVNQPQPQVQVQRNPQAPQVQVEPAQPQVNVQQAQAQPNVQVQPSQEPPKVRYEGAEPRVVVNAPQGQPQVRIERTGEPQQQAGQTRPPQGQQAQASAQQAQPGQPAGSARVTDPAGLGGTVAALPPRPATDQPVVTGAVNPTGLTVSRVTDMDLYNPQNEQLGEVERVVQGRDGKQYLVIGRGGFLGLGERHVAIPTERVAMRGDRLVIQGMTNDQIKAMPTFDRNDRAFRELEDNQAVQITAMR
jgi:hypothetical protein